MALDIAVDKANTVSWQHWVAFAAVVAVAHRFGVGHLVVVAAADRGPD